jgi:hypothetical protein
MGNLSVRRHPVDDLGRSWEGPTRLFGPLHEAIESIVLLGALGNKVERPIPSRSRREAIAALRAALAADHGR